MSTRTKAKARDLMDGKNVLAQYAQLAQELTAAHAAEHEERRNVANHNAAAERFNATRMRLYGDKARGRLNGLEELNEAEHGWASARRQAANAAEQQQAAHIAIEAVQHEIAALYHAHLDVFAAEAEKRTQAAAEALAALAGPYNAAWHTWAQARAAWRPLQSAIFEAVLHNEHVEGVYRDRATTHRDAMVPELPLPEPGFLAGIPDARPPAMQPVADEADTAA